MWYEVGTMHHALLVWLFTAMSSWMGTPTPGSYRETEYRAIAEASADAAHDDPERAAQAAALARFESGLSLSGRLGKLGERGPWQILGNARGDLRGPRGDGTLAQQAAEALRRWETGMCLYTGETRAAPECPLAGHRFALAVTWVVLHPFVPPTEPLAAR